MEIPAVRSTIARLIEEQYRTILPGIMWIDDPGARFPPHFGKILVLVFLALTPYLVMREPLYLAISLLGVAATVSAIPVVTYLTYRGKSYDVVGRQLIEKNSIFDSEETLNLDEVESTEVSKGLFPRLLGIGKVYLLNKDEKVIFQLDYLEDPESVESDVKQLIR